MLKAMGGLNKLSLGTKTNVSTEWKMNQLCYDDKGLQIFIVIVDETKLFDTKHLLDIENSC